MQQTTRILRWSFGRYRPVIRSFFSNVGKSHLIFPAAFLTATAIGAVNLGLIFYVRLAYGFAPATVGWFAASYSVWYLLGCIFLRPLARRLRPRYSLMIATGSMGAIMLALLLIGHAGVAFVLYSLFGLSASLFWPPLMGWLSSGLEGKELNRTISRFNLSWSSGSIISPYIAGALAQIANRLAIFFGVVMLVAATLLIMVATLYWSRIRSDEYVEPTPVKGNRSRDGGTPLRFAAWTGIVATYLMIGVLGNIFPMFARDHTILSKGQIGLVLLVRALVSTAAFMWIGRVTFWHERKAVIVGGQVALAGSIAFMFLVRSLPGFLAAVTVFGIIYSFNYSSSVFHGVAGSVQRAKRMSVHESISTFGVVAGSAVGGELYQAYGMGVVYLVCIIAALIGAIIQIVMLIRFGSLRDTPLPRSE